MNLEASVVAHIYNPSYLGDGEKSSSQPRPKKKEKYQQVPLSKISQAGWYMPTIPDTGRARVGGW
jgi:hypothetical protein